MNRNRILSIMAVVLVMSVAISPLLAEDTSAETVSEDPEYDSFILGLVIGFSIGLAVGIAGTFILNDPEKPPAGVDMAEVYKTFRGMESDKVIAAMDSANAVICSMLPSDADLWSFTTNYWQRAIEYAVSTYWTMDTDYDANMMLMASGLVKNIQNYTYDWQSTVDKAYNVRAQQQIDWTQSDDCYKNMQMGLSWGSKYLTAGTAPTEQTKTFSDLTQIVTPKDSDNLVFLDTSKETSGGSYDVKTSGTLYVFGTQSATVREMSTGKTFTLTSGANVIGSMPSGLYKLETSATYAGPMTRAGGSDAADVSGGMVLGQGSELYYALSDDSKVTIYDKNRLNVYSGKELSYCIKYDGTDGQKADKSYIVNIDKGIDVIGAYDQLITAINTSVDKTSVSGESIWNIFDICEESNSFISPSSITTTVPGVDLDATQSEAVYIQAMQQIVSYYGKHGTELADSAIVTNKESLSLYCYGDIYYNGRLYAENVICTPYCSSETQVLKTERMTWSGVGFAMVWDQVDRYSDWNGKTSPVDYALIALDSGYELDIEKIVYNGKDIKSLDLKLLEIEKFTVDPVPTPDPPVLPKVTDVAPLVMIIMIELAAILFLLGWILNFRLLWLVALIVLIMGLVFSGQISTLLLR